MNISCTRMLVALVLLVLAGIATAADGLKPYSAEYEVMRNGDKLGVANVTLGRTASGWDYESRTHSTGMASLAAANIEEHSIVSAINGLLQVTSYHYRLSTIVKSTQRDIVVEPATNRIVIRDKKHTREFPITPGVLDQHAVTLAIAQDLANGKHGTLSYPVATKDNVDTQRYQVGKEETLKVPAGSLRTVVVTRLRESANGRTTVSWFGLDNGYVPVRVVQTEPGGEVLEMRLMAVTK
jgi:hypothetical protein